MNKETDGLEGVIAARTVISHADGEHGKIWVRGVPIDQVVTRGFEGAVALLWEGFVGQGLSGRGALCELGKGRALAFSRLAGWLPAAKNKQVTEALRVALAALPDDSTPSGIAGMLPVVIAALLRTEGGQEPLPPDPSLGTAEDFLRMWHGRAVEPSLIAALDRYLTTVIDNGLGSSAFAGRVIISTGASLAAAVTGAYAAFTGPLHGGAPSLALDMLDAIAASQDVDDWFDRRLAGGARLIGFGHRVFRRRDPRADILRAAVRELAPSNARLAFAQDVERRALAALKRRKPGRSIEANIEMDAAILLEAMGVPRRAFTPVFAMGRAPSWIAHALEQKRSGRMIRPTSLYVGELHSEI
jgi:citrate synthase